MPETERAVGASVRPADSAAWDRVVVNTYGLRQHSLVGDDYAIKLFEARPALSSKPVLVGGPFHGDGGAVFSRGHASGECVSRLKSLLQETGAGYLLVKTRENVFADHAADINIDTSHFTFLLDLRGGPDVVWKEHLDSKVRNQVRKGQKSAVEVRFGGQELLGDAHAAISRCWRDLGTPTHGRRFYEEILAAFGEECRFAVTFLDGRAIGAALLLLRGNTIFHPWAGVFQEYKSLAVGNVLYWKIIEFACGRGIEWFDMGRSRRDQGTYAYKAAWGGRLVQLYYNYVLAPGWEPPRFDRGVFRLATAAWKHMPLALANRIGPHLIRGILF